MLNGRFVGRLSSVRLDKRQQFCYSANDGTFRLLKIRGRDSLSQRQLNHNWRIPLSPENKSRGSIFELIMFR